MSKLLRSVLQIALVLGACSSDGGEDSQIDPRPLDQQYPARITLSDAGEFYARPQIIISGRGSTDPQSGAHVVLQANGTNFSKVTSTEAYREGRPDMDLGFTIEINAAQATALGAGDTVSIEDGVGLGYGEPDRQVYRIVTALTAC